MYIIFGIESAIDATTIEVTWSNGETSEVELDEALVDGENEVTFEVDGVEYTETVEYEAPGVEVSAVNAVNPTTVALTFSVEVNEDDNLEFSFDGDSIDSENVEYDGNIVWLSVDEMVDGDDYDVEVTQSVEDDDDITVFEDTYSFNAEVYATTSVEAFEAVDIDSLTTLEDLEEVQELQTTTQQFISVVADNELQADLQERYDDVADELDELVAEQVNPVNNASTQLQLLNALDSSFFSDVDEDLIVDYRAELGENSNNEDLTSIQEVQDIIDEVNEGGSFAQLQSDLQDASNQIERLSILNDNFDRVNEDFINEYDAEFNVGTDDFNNVSSREDIQAGLDSVNIERTGHFVGEAQAEATSENVDAAKDALAYVRADDADDENDTVRADLEESLELALASNAVITARNSSELNSALNAEVLELENVHEDLADLYFTTVEDIVEDEDFDLLSPDGDIQSNLIDTVNGTFSDFTVEDSSVAAGANAEPSFTVTALQNDGETFAEDGLAENIQVTIGDLPTRTYADANFVDGVLELDGETFSLEDLDSYDVDVTYDLDGETYELSTNLDVVADNASAVESTLSADLEEYTSGDDITFDVQLLDDSENVVTSNDGTVATIVRLDTGNGVDTYYQNVVIEDGQATFSVDARTAGEDVDVEVDFGFLTLNEADVFDVEVGAASEIDVDESDALDELTLTVTDGYNTVEEYDSQQLVNFDVIDSDGETVADAITNADSNDNLVVDFTDGVSTPAVGLNDVFEDEEEYTITSTIDELTGSTTFEVVTP